MSVTNDTNELKKQFKDEIKKVLEFRGEHSVTVSLQSLPKVLEHCCQKLGYDFLLDITSIDHLEDEPRFEVVYELATLNDSKHLRIKAGVAEEEEVPTATNLWLTADWHEREIYDMMGVRFTDHPNLERILMWEGYPHFPLRKDFPLAGEETELPEVAFTGVAPMEGGPFVAKPGGNYVSAEPRAKGES